MLDTYKKLVTVFSLALMLNFTLNVQAQLLYSVSEIHDIGKILSGKAGGEIVKVELLTLEGAVNGEERLIHIGESKLTQAEAEKLLGTVPNLRELYQLWSEETNNIERRAEFIVSGSANLKLVVSKNVTDQGTNVSMFFNGISLGPSIKITFLTELEQLLSEALSFTPGE